MGNNETIEIYMNDEIMVENVSVQWERRINEDNVFLNTCTKKNLATTLKIIFVLDFLLCRW
jgi:hypothetical protein